MPDRDKVSRCFLSVTLFMFLMALAVSVTSVANLDGFDHQSTTAISDTKRGGRLAAGTPHGPIKIDGDANFSDTALLEGWPGDGSPENPYIIDGLEIDLEGEISNCISISNTRVSFIISNCSFTGAGGSTSWPEDAGIHLENVTNSELVNNTCHNNGYGITLWFSYSNTVANNTCTKNFQGITLISSSLNTVTHNTCKSNGREEEPWKSGEGISIYSESDYNAVTDNTCNSNDQGIVLAYSDSNTVANNICTNNTNHGIALERSNFNTLNSNICSNNTEIGIHLYFSDSNTLVDNICNYNRIGIWFHNSYSNIWVDNICSGNTEQGMFEDFEPEETEVPEVGVPESLLVFGFIALTLLGAGWRMAKVSRGGISEPWIGEYAIVKHGIRRSCFHALSRADSTRGFLLRHS